MNTHSILWPMFVQVALTFAVWIALYRSRIGKIRRNDIDPQRLATNADAQHLMKEVAGPADNFVNLFEVPVLFFAAILTAYVTQTVDWILLVLAWAFVLGRVVHSVIHITYNRVLHRFFVYVISTTMVWLMWLWLAIKLIFTGTFTAA